MKKKQTKRSVFQMRVTPEFMDAIDAWRKTQDDFPTVTDAVKTLVEMSLRRARIITKT